MVKINFEIFKVLWFYFKDYGAKLAFLLSLMFFSGLLESVNLAIMYPIINYGLEIENQSAIIRFFNFIIELFGSGNYFFSACVLLIGVALLSASLKYVFTAFSHKMMIRIVGDTQKAVFGKYLKADYNYFVLNQQGKLIHTATIAPDHVSNLVLFAIRGANDFINAVALFCMLMILSFYGTLFLSLAGIAYLLYIRRINERIIYTAANSGNQADRIKNVVMNEFITGIKPIKIFLSSGFWEDKYNQCVDKKLFHQYRMLMGQVIPEITTKVVFFMIVGLMGVLLSFQPHNEIVAALPMLGTFVIIANRFIPSVNALGSDLMGMVNALPNSQIIYSLLNEKIDTLPTGVKELPGFERNIQFVDVSLKYASHGDDILKNISFCIRKKEMTAIVGSSGSGKSTIVNLLLKLYRPDRGSVLIDGVSIFEYDNRSYLSQIGYVSQETFIFNDTIKENIRFGMQNCTPAMIEEAARLANAHEFIVNLQDGYDTVVGDAGVMLSGGQRQRIAIARGMLRKPEIMVLDEATSSLDNISERKVQDAITNISEYTTVIVIAHRLTTILNADMIVVIENGEIMEQGRHKDLMLNKGTYFKLYQSFNNA